MARPRASYFAAFLDLLGKRVLVVGGGSVAASKVRALLPCQPGALVLVAPQVSPGIQKAVESGQLEWRPREYQSTDLTPETALVFGATDDRALNARVAADARSLGVPVLAVDDVPNCDFIAPALVRRGDITIAITTAGRSPAMARRTRELLSDLVPPHWGDLLDVAADVRERLGTTKTLVDADRWQGALRGEVEALVAAGKPEEARERLLHLLERSLFESGEDDRAASEADAPLPRVAIVGAGPGDPDLLTLGALKRLQKADVVVHDRLVSDQILALANPHAERIDVGKAPGGRGWTQAEINALLVRLGQAQTQRVVRLKGGDPFVFGRGGEEALELAQAGVPFEVLPGISSALAAPAAAGIPVTHRGLSASVTVLDGHDPSRVVVPPIGTLVCLMAMDGIESLTETLQQQGRQADEPAALIQWATTPRQRTLVATLATIAQRAREQSIGAPAVLVVGPTAELGKQLRGHAREGSAGAPSSPAVADPPADYDATDQRALAYY
jgi:uroporphyrin-III C-methyltransferase/precorrin-2 dehydrogenase/sirohydrochlorin ferrochelatase